MHVTHIIQPYRLLAASSPAAADLLMAGIANSFFVRSATDLAKKLFAIRAMSTSTSSEGVFST